MSEANGIAVTPEGMGQLVAEMTEGETDAAFFAQYELTCANLVDQWRAQGCSRDQISGFLHQYAQGASFRRAELKRGVRSLHPEGHA